MTREQYKTHVEADRGVSIVTQVEQLVRWIENDWAKDDDSIGALRNLAAAINKAFPAKEKAAV